MRVCRGWGFQLTRLQRVSASSSTRICARRYTRVCMHARTRTHTGVRPGALIYSHIHSPTLPLPASCSPHLTPPPPALLTSPTLPLPACCSPHLTSLFPPLAHLTSPHTTPTGDQRGPCCISCTGFFHLFLFLSNHCAHSEAAHEHRHIHTHTYRLMHTHTLSDDLLEHCAY